MAGPRLEPVPSDRFSPARFELEYLRPWGILDIHQGRLALGLPVLAPFWVGLSVGVTAAPTVEELDAGVWVRGADWLRAEVSRRELQVGTLEPFIAFDAELDLSMISGPWRLGWSGEVEGLGGLRTGPVVRRFLWVGYSGSVGEVALGRRTQPWTGAVRWESAIALRIGAGLRFALRWREEESVFALEWGAAALAFMVSSVWTGPRAGSFGFRVAERR
jgi:hypothetical protein